jgi:hypothetical protein
VGTVDFLAQIRLEIQLHWDFKWLEIEHITDYLEYAYENRQDILWSDQFFKGLIDFNKTVDKVHKHMQHFEYAFRESEDQPQAKYLTSIFEVAQFALLWKDTNGNGAFWYEKFLLGASSGANFFSSSNLVPDPQWGKVMCVYLLDNDQLKKYQNKIFLKYFL